MSMKASVFPLFFLCVISASLDAQVTESNATTDEMRASKLVDWLTSQGQDIRLKETNRLVRKSEDPEFVRRELIDLYINTRVHIEYLNQLYAFQSANQSPAFMYEWGKSNRKEISDAEDKAIRLLDILSRMPVPKSK